MAHRWGRGDGNNDVDKPPEGQRSLWAIVMRSAPSARRGFFPLDEELDLLAGSLTPCLEEAAGMLLDFLGVQISKATVGRHTESNGAAYVAVQTAAVAEIEQELPAPPAGPTKQLLSLLSTVDDIQFA